MSSPHFAHFFPVTLFAHPGSNPFPTSLKHEDPAIGAPGAFKNHDVEKPQDGSQ
jgi:hypothetical protein